ncbi:MAG: hypothetical protein KDA88_07325 [Planctomycetaceae bacterium]|nr:hypothetical protein [Planctomycetaceae bacterium]MCB9953909.1 hypothetical protein [Planctomycetaceae bacterium]
MFVRYFKGTIAFALLSLAVGCDQPGMQLGGDNGGGQGAANQPEPAVMVYRRLENQPQITISNLQFEGSSDDESVTFDWSLQSGQILGFLRMIVVPESGDMMYVEFRPGFGNSGTEGAQFTTIGPGTAPKLSWGCQVFLAIEENGNLFQVSNAITTGKFSRTVTVQEPLDEWKQAAAQSVANQSEVDREMQRFSGNPAEDALRDARNAAREFNERNQQPNIGNPNVPGSVPGQPGGPPGGFPGRPTPGAGNPNFPQPATGPPGGPPNFGPPPGFGQPPGQTGPPRAP